MDWTAQGAAWRLRAGAHVFQEAEDRWTLCTPEEDFVSISLPPEVSPRVQGDPAGGTRSFLRRFR